MTTEVQLTVMTAGVKLVVTRLDTHWTSQPFSEPLGDEIQQFILVVGVEMLEKSLDQHRHADNLG